MKNWGRMTWRLRRAIETQGRKPGCKLKSFSKQKQGIDFSIDLTHQRGQQTGGSWGDRRKEHTQRFDHGIVKRCVESPETLEQPPSNWTGRGKGFCLGLVAPPLEDRPHPEVFVFHPLAAHVQLETEKTLHQRHREPTECWR